MILFPIYQAPVQKRLSKSACLKAHDEWCDLAFTLSTRHKVTDDCFIPRQYTSISHRSLAKRGNAVVVLVRVPAAHVAECRLSVARPGREGSEIDRGVRIGARITERHLA